MVPDYVLTTASSTNRTHFCSSLMTSDPAGIGVSSSIVARRTYLFAFHQLQDVADRRVSLPHGTFGPLLMRRSTRCRFVMRSWCWRMNGSGEVLLPAVK